LHLRLFLVKISSFDEIFLFRNFFKSLDMKNKSNASVSDVTKRLLPEWSRQVGFGVLNTFFWGAILCVQTAIGQTPEKPKTAEELDAFITQKMKESGMIGLGAAVIVDQQVVWTKGYGFADIDHQKPFTINTLMNIASISKTFTGACIMKAQEEGRLSLDEDINAYLPFKVINPYQPKSKITLRHLATHTSGLVDRSPFYSDSLYHYGSDAPESLGDFLRNYFVPGGKYYSKQNFLHKKPGTYRDYSNIAAGLAGYILECRTGKKLSEYCQEKVFAPLNMQKSAWFLAETDLSLHSKLYKHEAEKPTEIPLYSVTTYPDGGVRTSVAELSKFFISLLNGGEYQGTRILAKSTVEAMLTLQFTAKNKPKNVKLDEKNSGIFWQTKYDCTMVGHGGSDPGVSTEMLATPDKKIGVILFMNMDLEGPKMGAYVQITEELLRFGRGMVPNNVP
jgi:CubicO group peptidase (beta-lactamase class C family)